MNDGILRCGTKEWGYRHIAHRWSKSFEGRIKTTLYRWDKFGAENNRRIYCLKVAASVTRYWFKVVWTSAEIPGAGYKRFYIITATWDSRQAGIPEDQKSGCAKIK
ncbi:hypothetical protein [Nonomuraea sp. B19D2]|uniref:hypothetical protein n=1 Tax=Nonomuraea sp. B19D2 TaxID=3159561 RepID=UPI0032DB5A35